MTSPLAVLPVMAVRVVQKLILSNWVLSLSPGEPDAQIYAGSEGHQNMGW